MTFHTTFLLCGGCVPCQSSQVTEMISESTYPSSQIIYIRQWRSREVSVISWLVGETTDSEGRVHVILTHLPMNLTYWLFHGTYGQVLVNQWKRNFHLSRQSYKSLYPQRVYGVFHLEILYWGLPWWSCGWDSAPNAGGTGSIPGRGTRVL